MRIHEHEKCMVGSASDRLGIPNCYRVLDRSSGAGDDAGVHVSGGEMVLENCGFVVIFALLQRRHLASQLSAFAWRR